MIHTTDFKSKWIEQFCVESPSAFRKCKVFGGQMFFFFSRYNNSTCFYLFCTLKDANTALSKLFLLEYPGFETDSVDP